MHKFGGQMNRFSKKLSQVILVLVIFAALSGCSGATATPDVTPTAAVSDASVVMTNAAETAIPQFTLMAAQASPTSEPSQTATIEPAITNTPEPLAATATLATGLEQLVPTSTLTGGGQPATETPAGNAGSPTSAANPSLTPMLQVSPTSAGNTTSSGPTCHNAKYVADVTIPDGTVFKPGDKFRKVWRIQNTGTCKWDQGFGLTIWAGDAMGGVPIHFTSSDAGVESGGIVDLGIDMIAPSEPGDYVAHWIMIDDNQKTFGGDFTVVIKVAK
jgi:hypothetical protein